MTGSPAKSVDAFGASDDETERPLPEDQIEEEDKENKKEKKREKKKEKNPKRSRTEDRSSHPASKRVNKEVDEDPNDSGPLHDDRLETETVHNQVIEMVDYVSRQQCLEQKISLDNLAKTVEIQGEYVHKLLNEIRELTAVNKQANIYRKSTSTFDAADCGDQHLNSGQPFLETTPTRHWIIRGFLTVPRQAQREPSSGAIGHEVVNADYGTPLAVDH
ncbi:hypothetical protein B9Z55_003149 [Caenorhabditis nigoni]|uniref:Uncharacterized protein n=1 Tax=Caenorhabditis nigoni TaxID=1611254 RepID=A0A2G5VP50_9PELO|nr:hypothetical protein B9Z55_003149 [Caenorhabditis nigoni]